ncbi:MAG TPA: allantoicase [Burkholderiaceae bacterium]|nr:allantoicase [Burkholderiaceae bacterium]
MSAAQLPAGTVVEAGAVELPEYAQRYINLASEDAGARVLACSDEFFAAARRCLQSSAPVFVAGKFDEHGKWMDGWETRRRRRGGYDHAVIQLACPGRIRGLDIDTSHFTGNYPPAASVQACYSDGAPDATTSWTEIVAVMPLSADSHHFVELPDDDRVWTHLRLNIYPDGGIARFRVYGQPAIDWSTFDPDALHEVSALHLGGRVIAWSDAHYGNPSRILMPGRGVNMGDGWETRRRREPGYDWCIIELAHPVIVGQIEIDTAHFKGNYPDRVSVQAAWCDAPDEQAVITQAMFWPELLPEQVTEMDKQHIFEGAVIQPLGAVTHVRVNMIPDGGISRVRIHGRLSTDCPSDD